MSLIDLPIAVIGGAFRLARLPLDLVLGSSRDGAASPSTPPSKPDEHASQTPEQRRQADALRRAVNGQL